MRRDKATDLSDRERQLLLWLQGLSDRNRGPLNDGWVRPMDLGGSNGSHHHYTLQKLVRLGLVLERRRVCSIVGALGSSKAGRLYHIAPSFGVSP